MDGTRYTDQEVQKYKLQERKIRLPKYRVLEYRIMDASSPPPPSPQFIYDAATGICDSQIQVCLPLEEKPPPVPIG
jgi:hypothetical protein